MKKPDKWTYLVLELTPSFVTDVIMLDFYRAAWKAEAV